MLVCTYPSRFLLNCGPISVWTLLWDFLGLSGDLILISSSLIVFLRWSILFCAKRRLMHYKWQRCFFVISTVFMGLPLSIVSDHDSRFLGHFWRSLWKLLGTNLDMNSAYHPQTDGQTKVTNRSLGNLLQSLVGDAIKTWDSKLSQAEFAHNHSLNQSLGFCPFQVIYGVIPRVSVALSNLSDRTRVHGEASSFVDTLAQIHYHAVLNLEASATKYKQAADFHRRKLVFEVGDLVWAYLTRDRMPSHAYNKLNAKKIGPLKVLQRINDNAYRCRLPVDITTGKGGIGRHNHPTSGLQKTIFLDKVGWLG